MKHTKVLALIVAILVGIAGVYYIGASHAEPVTPVAQTVAPITPPDTAGVFTDVNNERVKAGLPALVDDPRLDASASAKCADEETNNYHEHVSPAGVTWQSFFAPELQHSHIGENLSWGYTSSQLVVNGWIGSPTHLANILDPTYTHVGYAVCSLGDGGNLIVQHFEE